MTGGRDFTHNSLFLCSLTVDFIGQSVALYIYISKKQRPVMGKLHG